MKKPTAGEGQVQRLAHELRFGSGPYQDRIDAGGRRFDAAIRRAVLAERKRCAKVAEKQRVGTHPLIIRDAILSGADK